MDGTLDCKSFLGDTVHFLKKQLLLIQIYQGTAINYTAEYLSEVLVQ